MTGLCSISNRILILLSLAKCFDFCPKCGKRKRLKTNDECETVAQLNKRIKWQTWATMKSKKTHKSSIFLVCLYSYLVKPFVINIFSSKKKINLSFCFFSSSSSSSSLSCPSGQIEHFSMWHIFQCDWQTHFHTTNKQKRYTKF